MSELPVDLQDLGIFNLDGFTDEEVYDFGEEEYLDQYIDQGKKTGDLTTHDGENVVFFADNYHHAFNTSKNRRKRAFRKDKVDRQRVARIEWIRIIIEGRAKNTECWEVPLRVPEEGKRPFPGKRAYVSWEHNYIIWLEPRKNGGFKFSTAYCPSRQQLAQYLKHSNKIWSNT